MVTMTGMVIGTPACMSPEQLMDSHNIDARSDIYSLGVVFCEMLAGRSPYSGKTSDKIVKELLASPRSSSGSAAPEGGGTTNCGLGGGLYTTC